MASLAGVAAVPSRARVATGCGARLQAEGAVGVGWARFVGDAGHDERTNAGDHRRPASPSRDASPCRHGFRRLGRRRRLERRPACRATRRSNAGSSPGRSATASPTPTPGRSRANACASAPSPLAPIPNASLLYITARDVELSSNQPVRQPATSLTSFQLSSSSTPGSPGRVRLTWLRSGRGCASVCPTPR